MGNGFLVREAAVEEILLLPGPIDSTLELSVLFTFLPFVSFNSDVFLH